MFEIQKKQQQSGNSGGLEMKYAIRREKYQNEYLQGTEPNANYSQTATAPTMGKRHDVSEYSTVWGTEEKSFERLTAAGYIATLMEEFRWGSVKPFSFVIIPKEEHNNV